MNTLYYIIPPTDITPLSLVPQLQDITQENIC